MPYERLNLVDGEVLTAEHIAHMESGMGSGYQRLNLVDGEVLTAGHISHMEDGIIAAQSGGGGSGGGSTEEKDVIFIDYDGTILHSYTVEEAQELNELPPLPSHAGLICQGWNFDFETIKLNNAPLVVGATYITDDGTTRIYITLNEGRTSPMLGVCPNGTVTVDWGDGTEPDVLTGTSTSTVKWTPNHNYAEPGDYVIRLTVDGEMGFAGESGNGFILRQFSSADNGNKVYLNSVKKLKIGNGVASIGDYSFYNCYSLASVTIPESVTSIGSSTFSNCYGIRYYDFTGHTSVPVLSSTSAFTNMPFDCEIRVPAALYDEWIAAENWSTYASQIVAV